MRDANREYNFFFNIIIFPTQIADFLKSILKYSRIKMVNLKH